MDHANEPTNIPWNIPTVDRNGNQVPRSYTAIQSLAGSVNLRQGPAYPPPQVAGPSSPPPPPPPPPSSLPPAKGLPVYHVPTHHAGPVAAPPTKQETAVAPGSNKIFRQHFQRVVGAPIVPARYEPSVTPGSVDVLNRIIDTFELLAHILVFLPNLDLLNASNINITFAQHIARSKKLQEKLFLRATRRITNHTLWAEDAMGLLHLRDWVHVNPVIVNPLFFAALMSRSLYDDGMTSYHEQTRDELEQDGAYGSGDEDNSDDVDPGDYGYDGSHYADYYKESYHNNPLPRGFLSGLCDKTFTDADANVKWLNMYLTQPPITIASFVMNGVPPDVGPEYMTSWNFDVRNVRGLTCRDVVKAVDNQAPHFYLRSVLSITFKGHVGLTLEELKSAEDTGMMQSRGR